MAWALAGWLAGLIALARDLISGPAPPPLPETLRQDIEAGMFSPDFFDDMPEDVVQRFAAERAFEKRLIDALKGIERCNR